jgi:hypothetical protein
MRGVLEEVRRIIRAKTQSQWKAFFRAQIDAIRAFAQTQGEKAAFGGFLVGIFIVLFYKLFIFIVTILTLVYLIIITAADDDRSGC